MMEDIMKTLKWMLLGSLLTMSSQAFAEQKNNKEAEEILLKGKIVSEHWDKDSIHHTRVIYRGKYWGCFSYMWEVETSKGYDFYLHCSDL